MGGQLSCYENGGNKHRNGAKHIHVKRNQVEVIIKKNRFYTYPSLNKVVVFFGEVNNADYCY